MCNPPCLQVFIVKMTVMVAMAVWCVAQHAAPRSTAQHTCALQHNSTIGITHLPSVVLAEIGGKLATTLYKLV